MHMHPPVWSITILLGVFASLAAQEFPCGPHCDHSDPWESERLGPVNVVGADEDRFDASLPAIGSDDVVPASVPKGGGAADAQTSDKRTSTASVASLESLGSQSSPPTNQLANGPRPDQWVSQVWERFVAEGPTGDGVGDFSYAGYHRGEKEIPDIPVVVHAVDHGVVASDGQDDTEAIEVAIAAAHAAGGGAVLLPNGQMDVGALGRGIEVTHSDIVLRGGGSGPGGTTVNLTAPIDKSAAIVLRGEKWPKGLAKLATVTSPITRGDFEVEVDDSSDIEVGMKLRIRISVLEGSPMMAQALTTPFQLDPELHGSTLTTSEIHWFAEVVAVPGPTTVRLARPFRIDVPADWTVEFFTHAMIEEVGIEYLRVDTDWPGEFRHHKPHGEPGDPDYRSRKEQDYLWPGVQIQWAWNGWMRDVVVANTNWSIACNDSTGFSMLGLGSQGIAGHAFAVMGGHDCLIVNPVLEAPTVHTFYFANRASGNVVTGAVLDFEPDLEASGGKKLDFHGLFPFENLCEGARDAYVNSGGPVGQMPHAGIRNVLWDVRAPADTPWGMPDNGEFLHSWRTSSNRSMAFEYYPQTFIVGVHRAGEARVVVQASSEDRSDEWLTIEGLNREGVFPKSLYGAQLELRLQDTVPPDGRRIRVDVEDRDLVEAGIDGSFEPVPAEFGLRPTADEAVIEFVASTIDGAG